MRSRFCVHSAGSQTTDVIASLSATTKQLEGDISASRAALDAAQAQLAATAALQHHTAAEAAATEQRLMATQVCSLA